MSQSNRIYNPGSIIYLRVARNLEVENKRELSGWFFAYSLKVAGVSQINPEVRTFTRKSVFVECGFAEYP